MYGEKSVCVWGGWGGGQRTADLVDENSTPEQRCAVRIALLLRWFDEPAHAHPPDGDLPRLAAAVNVVLRTLRWQRRLVEVVLLILLSLPGLKKRQFEQCGAREGRRHRDRVEVSRRLAGHSTCGDHNADENAARASCTQNSASGRVLLSLPFLIAQPAKLTSIER